MGDLIVAAAVLTLVAAVAVRYVRRIRAGGCGCGGGGGAPARARPLMPADTDESHYPHVVDLRIEGMSCEGCARNVERALNALDGTWARVDLSGETAHVLSKEPIDLDACAKAVRDAGYSVRAS